MAYQVCLVCSNTILSIARTTILLHSCNCLTAFTIEVIRKQKIFLRTVGSSWIVSRISSVSEKTSQRKVIKLVN